MSEWIEWRGGKRPVGVTVIVETKLRGGGGGKGPAGVMFWGRDNKDYDIVAYRVIDPPPGPITMDEPASALAVQEGGDHYKKLSIQPIEYIHANGIPFAEGCVIKYVSRWRDKGGIKDLEKARHFLDLLIELETKGGAR